LFTNLTRLRMWGTGPRVIGTVLDALAAAGASCQLRSLEIQFDSLRQFAAILGACLPASLRILRVPAAMLHSEGTRALVGALATPGLRLLELTSNGTGNDGADAVFRSPNLAGLKVLSLRYCLVGDDALRALLDDSPLADGLDLLDLTGSTASAEVKQAVKERMGERVRV
jgi:hypothetical protein